MTGSVVQVLDGERVIIQTPNEAPATVSVRADQPASIIDTPVGPRGQRGSDGIDGPPGPPGAAGPPGPMLEWSTTQW